jgi:hypothetical protein
MDGARWRAAARALEDVGIAVCTIEMIADILHHLLTNDPSDRYATTAWPPRALRSRPEMHLLTTSSVQSDLSFLRGALCPSRCTDVGDARRSIDWRRRGPQPIVE